MKPRTWKFVATTISGGATCASFRTSVIRHITQVAERFWAVLKAVKAPPRPYSEVDRRIKPLVDAMNATGVIETIASCEGHASFAKPPYVMLKTSVEVASSIEQELRKGGWFSNPQTHAIWAMEGTFDLNCELRFVLRASEYHENCFSIKRLRFLAPFRRKVDADLRFLEKVIRELSLPERR